ncbi:aldo/keto reductase [Micromonospora zamorensis]|uniref:aldo/keto reductase n=1 Tax=Micromonospora zamorensis TaxID=709883 RepID=UPI003408E070
MRDQVEENLRRLGRDQLDVVNLRLGRGPGAVPLAERFGALADLRAAGLIRHLGLSNVRPEQLDDVAGIAPVVCVQNNYGVDAYREQDAFVRACGERGIAYVPFFALAGTGREAGASATQGEAVDAVARAHGVPPLPTCPLIMKLVARHAGVDVDNFMINRVKGGGRGRGWG